MPRTITLEDGTTQEVPTEEEVKALQEKARKVDELSKTVETLQKEKEAIEDDPVNKNWRAMREVNDKLKAAIKAQGKEVKEDGTIVEAPKMLTAEEIEAKARGAARSEMMDIQKKNALAKFDDEKRKVVEVYFNKLTAGEEVTADNLDKFVSEAALLADPQALSGKKIISPRGAPPLLKPQEGNSFPETEAGQSIANEIFGDYSFAKKK